MSEKIELFLTKEELKLVNACMGDFITECEILLNDSETSQAVAMSLRDNYINARILRSTLISLLENNELNEVA